jgi:hypothetical protein
MPDYKYQSHSPSLAPITKQKPRAGKTLGVYCPEFSLACLGVDDPRPNPNILREFNGVIHRHIHGLRGENATAV